MGDKYIVRVDADGEPISKSEVKVHAGRDYEGDGFLCGFKDDFLYDVHHKLVCVRGKPAIEKTDKPVTCPTCLFTLNKAASYTRKKGKWY